MSKITTLSLLALLCAFLLGFSSTTYALETATTIKVGTLASVDGIITSPQETDETSVTILPMYVAGINDAQHPQVSTAYLVYNPNTQTMYVRIEVVSSLATLSATSDSYVTIVYEGKDDKIHLEQTPTTNGFESSFTIQPQADPYSIFIHVNIDLIGGTSGATSATLGFQGKVGIPVFVVPEYLYGGLAAIGACFVGFAVFKKRSSIPQLFHR